MLELCPLGLVTFTVQVSAASPTLMVIRSCVLLRKLSSLEVKVFEPPVHVTNTVGVLTKPVPLMVTGWELLDPGTGFGLTLLITGAAAETENE